MITNARQAASMLPIPSRYTPADEPRVAEVVEFLRRNPDETDNFFREVRDASDASNHVTPYFKICLVLEQALKKVK